MSKRHALEALIQTEFRWPTKGDHPFIKAAEPSDNAHIAEDDFARLVLMTRGYKMAGDLMVARTVESPSARDILVFPIIFNYRHFIELSLKYQLATHGPLVEIEPNWRTHDLALLLGNFLEMSERYGNPDPDTADPVVGQIILEFAKMDPRADALRYPVDRMGNPIPVASAALDLANLADVMNGVEGYFSGCDGYFSNCH